jgi:hypothetical protein
MQMNKLFKSIAISLSIAISIMPGSSLARDKKDNVQFFCGRINQDGKLIPTTQTISSGTSEAISLIVWKYNTPPKGMTNQQRCEVVSKRFQLAWNDDKFDKLIVGIDKKTGQGIVCAVPYTVKECTRSHLLFTVNMGSDADDILDRLKNILSGPGKGGPISQSSAENEVDMRLLIDRLKQK